MPLNAACGVPSIGPARDGNNRTWLPRQFLINPPPQPHKPIENAHTHLRQAARFHYLPGKPPARPRHAVELQHGLKLISLSLIHISEPTRQAEISYAVFCLKKKKKL